MLFPARVPPKAKQKGRVDFDLDQFRNLMQQKGMPAEWIQTTACPCSVPSTDAGMDLFQVTDVSSNIDHDPACTTCKGKGFIRYDSQDILCLFQQHAGANDTMEYGTSLNAGAMLTLLPEHLPSFGDKFRIKDSAIVRTEVLTKTASPLVLLNYPAVTRTLDLAAGPTQANILAVFINDPSGSNSFKLGEDQYDFLPASNQIRFLAGLPGVNKPADDSEFTIVYYTNPEFVVVSHPYLIRDTITFKKGVEKASAMPVRCEVRLESE